MTIFDLLFILLFLASFVTLLTAGVLLIRRRRATAQKILLVWIACFAIYMVIVSITALATPRRTMRLGEDRCSDDWCIAVERADHQGTTYTITFKLLSRTLRVSQREKSVYVYLTDAEGRRFDPASDPSAIPFDVLLGPGESVETTRSFIVPTDARDIGVVVAHEGSFCFPGCFIIGDEVNPLHKKTIVPLR
jgi:hypothetical protein